MRERTGRLIAIGDLHGFLAGLNRLLEILNPCAADQLVFLGDYIDRGPDSYGVIERLLALREQYPNTIFLRGNHDQWLLNWLFGDDDTFLYLGGRQTWQSYARAFALSPEQWPMEPKLFLERLPGPHLKFLDETRLSYERDGCIFVHAGLDPAIAELPKQNLYTLLMGHRDFFQARDFGCKVVVGHTSTQIFRRDSPVFLPSGIIMVDTSCERTGLLSAVEPVTGIIYQAQVAITDGSGPSFTP